MACKPRNRRTHRSARLVVCLFAISVVAHAQVTTELSEQKLAVGERVSLLLTVDHEEPADVSIPTLVAPGLRVVEGPTVRPVSILTDTGRERAVEIRFVLEATTAGRFVLPPTEVSVAGQLYLTEERLVSIGERQNRNRVPFLARWAGPSGAPFAGEARVYTLEIYNVPDYLYPSSIAVGSPQNAIVEEVQGLGSISQYVVDGVTLYAIPVAVFMVTPSDAGTMVLPEAEITGETLRAVAPARTISVQGLPEAVRASGAIGVFDYSVQLDPASFLRSESAVLRVRVAGRGNLHFLALPEPQITGFLVEHEDTRSSLVATERGYEGYVERVLRLRPSAADRHVVDPGDFAFYDPVRMQVRRLDASTIVPTIQDVNLPIDDSGDGVAIEPLGRDQIASMERRNWYRDPLSYGWLVPGLLTFIASRIWRRRHVAILVLAALGALLLVDAVSDRLPWTHIDRGLRRYAEGDLPAAIAAFERASRATPDSPGINHNLAVLYFQVGDVPRSVYAAREAIRLAPFADQPRALLRAVEQWASIERTVPPPHHIHPDLMFLVLAILVNLLFLGAASQRVHRRARSVIAAVFVLLLIGATVSGLVLTAVGHEHQVGVVRDGVTLRRIPGSDAAGWLPITSGAAVDVLARHENSLLVRTVLGLEGWISLDEILWHGAPGFPVTRYRGFGL